MNARQQSAIVRVSGILAIVTALTVGPGIAFPQGNTQGPRTALAVWDTGTSSAAALAPEAIEQKGGWKPIASGETAPVFQGDAVITNGRVLLVARQQGTGGELYSLGLGKPVLRTRLLLAPGAGNARVVITENSRPARGRG